MAEYHQEDQVQRVQEDSDRNDGRQGRVETGRWQGKITNLVYMATEMNELIIFFRF